MWGNLMGKKETTTVWIVFQNIGGFLKDKDKESKLEDFCRFATKRELAFLGWQKQTHAAILSLRIKDWQGRQGVGGRQAIGA